MQIQHTGLVQPAAAGADVGDIRYPGLVRPPEFKAPVQHVVVHGQVVPTIGGGGEFALPYRLEGMFAHKRPDPVATDPMTKDGKCCSQPPTAVAAPGRGKSRFQQGAGQTHLGRLVRPLLGAIVAGSAGLKDTATPFDGHSLLRL